MGNDELKQRVLAHYKALGWAVVIQGGAGVWRAQAISGRGGRLTWPWRATEEQAWLDP